MQLSAAAAGPDRDPSQVGWTGGGILDDLRRRHIAGRSRREHENAPVRLGNKESPVGGDADLVGARKARPSDSRGWTADRPHRRHVAARPCGENADLDLRVVRGRVVYEQFVCTRIESDRQAAGCCPTSPTRQQAGVATREAAHKRREVRLRAVPSVSMIAAPRSP